MNLAKPRYLFFTPLSIPGLSTRNQEDRSTLPNGALREKEEKKARDAKNRSQLEDKKMKLSNTLLILGAAASAVVLGCHTEGPTVPRPRKLKQSATFQHALSGLSKLLGDALAGTIRAGFDIHNISFSIGITSFDQPREDPLVWEYHHLSPANVNGTKAADRHSQYLVGSISKVITVCVVGCGVM